MFDDLRDFLEALDKIGQLKHVGGADWDLEIGTIAELMNEQSDAKALVFDKIKGYPEGYRIVTGILHTELGQRLGFGLFALFSLLL